MKSVKRYLSLALAATLAISVTACNAPVANPTEQQGESGAAGSEAVANESAGSEKEEEAENPVSGEITFSFWGVPEEVDIQEKLADAFMKANPNIKVTLDHVSGAGDYNQTILTRIAGGTAPDVFYLGEVMSPIYAERGVVEDLLPYAQRDGIDFNDYWPGVLSPCGYDDGHLWAFAKDCGPYFIYYNKADFDEIGEPYPDGTWTLDEFEEVAKKLTKTDDSGKVTRYGFAGENGWTSWFAFAYKNGGQIMDESGQRFVDDPKTAEVLQWYFDLANIDHVATNPDTMTSMGGAEVDAFKGGVASMIVGGRFMTYFLADFDGEYGFTTFPTNSGKEQCLQFVALGMAKDSQNKEASWEFIKFYCGKEGQEISSSTGLGLPTMKSVTESGVWMLPGETEEDKEVVLTQFENTKDLPFHPEWGKLIDDIWTRHMKEAARGAISAQEALTAATEECNQYLEENGY